MIRLSVSLFGLPLDRYAPIAEALDAWGAGGIWLADHLATPTRRATAYPYSPSGDPGYDITTPIADVLVLAGHLAARTERLHIGTGVYVLPLRPTAIVARGVATVQTLATGRFRFGVGTGWLREEFAALGLPFETRGAATDEMLTALRLLWSGQPTSFDGEHIAFSEIAIAPPPSHPVPIVVGGTAPAALRRAARHGDGWYGPPGDLTTAERARATIEEERSRLGRTQPFRYYVRLPAPYTPAAAAPFIAAGFDDLVITLAGAGSDSTAPLAHQLDALRAAIETLTG